MKCEKCGSEIKEGHLYCDVCGEEVRIVPDFDAALDESIQVNLADVYDEINPDSNVVNSETKEIRISNEATREINIKPNKEPQKEQLVINKVLIISIAAICMAVLVVCSVIYKNVREYYSYDAQYEEAFELFEAGDYEASIKKVKHVISIDENEERPKLLLCDNYYELGKYDEALAVLEKLMESFPGDMNIYERLVKNYDAKGDNKSISDLISSATDESVRYMYGDYLCPDISISPEGGSYDEVKEITLSTSSDGLIYYTLDGSEPDEMARIYTGPFEIEPGDTLVKAICINSRGIKSDVIETSYSISFTLPDPPSLKTKDGKYNTPTAIVVNVPEGETCYYTVDNSEPTAESNLYEGPIPMYIGQHSFKFACIDEKGTSSEVVSADFSLDIVNLIDMGIAKDNVILLLETGGKSTDKFTYKCEQATVVDGSTYYIINEYASTKIETLDEESDDEYIDKQTGNVYAVDVLTGLTYKAAFDKKSGTYSLSMF